MTLRDFLHHRFTFLALRLALGGIFLYAGVVKILSPMDFARAIAAYQLLPYFANFVLASTLPWIEALSGLLLIVGWKTRAGALVIIALNVVFIFAISSTMVRGLNIDCGCFRLDAAPEKTSPWIALARDAAFLLMALAISAKRDQHALFS